MSQEVIERIKNRSKGEPEFHQAIDEVYLNVEKIIEQNPQYKDLNTETEIETV